MTDTTTSAEVVSVLDEALTGLEANAHQPTDGIWLEDLTRLVAPHIRDWNIDGCWHWGEWPDREAVMPPGAPSVDVGIDLVARRRDDGGWIAIQCKSRQLDEYGDGAPVASSEMDKFLHASSNTTIWAERWLVVNGAVALGGHSEGKIEMSGFPVKLVNVAQDIVEQRTGTDDDDEQCPHCDPDNTDDAPIQARPCMQREAVDTAVERLNAHLSSDEPNIPRGEARGRIVLPCGTGKTRIALRITEQLTYPTKLSVVLCPSIALVAQTRREFLQNAQTPMRVMAVCSDKGVAADEEKIANTADATLDRGFGTVDEIKGCLVSTDPEQIARWIQQRNDSKFDKAVNVIFGTYQSAQRIAEAIKIAEAADAFEVLICDEAHRTAGLRSRKIATAAEERLREFTLCHDRDAFPATYRVYQTATPKIFSAEAVSEAERRSDKNRFVVRHMDDQATFGVELYRRSYADAVRNGWLSDYRIIAMAVSGDEATKIANALVADADRQAELDAASAATADGKRKAARPRASELPTTGDYLKGMGFALAMGGAARTDTGERLPLRSCIGFLNTITRSKAMTGVLQSEAVRDWVAKQAGEPVEYRLEHLDASASVAKRDEAKRRLAAANDQDPHGVLNVGIFGEGTDSPSLSAVAFLEPRRSPIDVVQAVGRAMRRAEGKEFGYIVVPLVIPSGVDAEQHLAVSDKHEGWQELGDILQALRAHDKRIEDALPEMLKIHLPPEEPALFDTDTKTVVVVGRPDKQVLEYAVVTATRDEAEDIARVAVKEDRPLLDYAKTEPFDDSACAALQDQTVALVVHAERSDQSTITRVDTVARSKPTTTQILGVVNRRQTTRRAKQMTKGQRGRDLPDPTTRAKQRAERQAEKAAKYEGHIQGVLDDLSEKLGDEITMNLLAKSGLTGNKVQRDLNLLRDAVEEAARYIHDETGLAAALDEHFGFDQLSAPKPGKPRADGATVAALLWMNAAMLQQRIHAGGWLGRSPIDALADIKASTDPEGLFTASWQAITRQDFLPVIAPASETLETARRSGRLGGLRRALKHLAGEAEQIAETYADMGTDHAGALFNKVMGDQSSDGAFFTRPVAADITARLVLDAADPDNTLDWSNPDVWRQHKTVDLACGSGTLLAATMTAMKRRAVVHGADTARLAALQRVAVEETIKGLDINPVSLQLAATQLMSGNTDIKYRRMGLHLMPYGPQLDETVAAGTPELFACRSIVDSLRLFDDAGSSTRIETGTETEGALEGPEMDDAVTAASDARIVIMNPPFTNRTKMGEKFDKADQLKLRKRMDKLEGFLEAADPCLSEMLDKNALRTQFAALADLCLNRNEGVFATVLPTTALTASSGLAERVELAKRFHIHTILTHVGVVDVNLSQGTHREMNESIVVMRRSPTGTNPPTRIIALDRFPIDESDTDLLFKGINESGTGTLPDGWGEISYWPAKRINAGDWSAAIWRSPELAAAAVRFATDPDLDKIGGGGGEHRAPFHRHNDCSATTTAEPPNGQAAVEGARDITTPLRRLPQGGLAVNATGQSMRDEYNKQPTGTHQPFPVLQSKGADGQKRIEAVPDDEWEWKHPGEPPILNNAGYLLVSMGQNTSTARLTAVASDSTYVGQGWMPVTGLDATEAKSVSVFLNSTPGRLLIMRQPGKSLSFPFYNPAAWREVGIPDLSDEHIVSTLADCWEATRAEIVPPFSAGYTDIRRRWDEAVCEGLGWDINEISELGELLADEPRVRGIARGQWKE